MLPFSEFVCKIHLEKSVKQQHVLKDVILVVPKPVELKYQDGR